MTCRSTVALLGFAVVTFCVSHAVFSGDWKVTDDIALTATHVDRNGERGYSGTVLELSPRWILQGRGARFEANVNYSPTLAVGTGDTDPKAFSHDLLATSRLEAIENKLFVGANAAARLTGDGSNSGSIDAINFNDNGGEQSFSLAIQPEFRSPLNRYAEIISNNSIDHVTYSGGNSNNSNALRLHLGLRSGRHFNRFDWGINTNYHETKYNDRDDERHSADVTVGYRVDSKLRVFGSVGYEDNDVATSRNDTKGTTWDIGTNWNPNPRTSVSAKYGDRYFGNSWSGNVNHRTKRTQLGLNFSRSVDNRRSQQLVDSFFFLVDGSGNILTDPATGQPLLANVPELQESDEDFVNTQLRGIVTLTGRRTTLNLAGTVSQRTYEISDSDEDSYQLDIRATRQLGSGYSGSLNAGLEQTDSDGGGDSDSYSVGFSLNKSFSKRSSASLNYSYREDDDDDSTGDYSEHRLGITLRVNLL